jgi:hypothetical protein
MVAKLQAVIEKQQSNQDQGEGPNKDNSEKNLTENKCCLAHF